MKFEGGRELAEQARRFSWLLCPLYSPQRTCTSVRLSVAEGVAQIQEENWKAVRDGGGDKSSAPFLRPLLLIGVRIVVANYSVYAPVPFIVVLSSSRFRLPGLESLLVHTIGRWQVILLFFAASLVSGLVSG